MDITLPSYVILWLVGANILLMIFVIIDRLLILRKRSADLEDKFVKEALANLHTQIQKTNKELSDNTISFQHTSQEQTLELLASIRATVFRRYETEFQMIDDSVKQSIAKLQNDAEQNSELVQRVALENNEKISVKYAELATRLEDAVNKIITESQSQVKKAITQSQEQVKTYMSQQLEARVNTIVAEVLHNSIRLHDHEKLIEESIQEYIKTT